VAIGMQAGEEMSRGRPWADELFVRQLFERVGKLQSKFAAGAS
jgi:hypothetical protein